MAESVPGMILKQLQLGPMMNFVYVIGCGETREAAVVDPAWDVPAILRVARDSDLQIRRVFLTHAHPDHMNGLEDLLASTDAIVYLHEAEVDYLQKVSEYFRLPTEFLTSRPGRVQTVSDGDEVLVGKVPVRIIHTPGHTPGSQCLLVQKSLLSGDTLFVDACGRVDLPGGDPEKMVHSLTCKLTALDDDIVLFPGHDYGGRSSCKMGEQKRTNRFLRNWKQSPI